MTPSFRRGVLLALPVAALLWALIGWGVSEAVGHPAAQARSDRVAAELSRLLHEPIEPRVVVVTHEMEVPERAGEFRAAEPDRYRIRPSLAAMFVQTGRSRGPWGIWSHEYQPGLEVVVHELLHRAETQPCWGPWPGGVNMEEGATQAVVADVLPALAWRLYRLRARAGDSYSADVRVIRAASRFATGSRSWREPAAHHWRRALRSADCDGRRAMLTYANERRAA